MATEDNGHFSFVETDLATFELSEEETAEAMADLVDAQALYSAVTAPEFERFMAWLKGIQVADVTSLITAPKDRVDRLQARAQLAGEILSLPDSLAVTISQLNERLSTDA